MAPHLLAIGDSHLEALKLAADLNILDAESSEFSTVPGATVIGLRNPNSQTDAVNIFKSFLTSRPVSSHLIIHLGEVDCGFVIWWRAKHFGESVEDQLQDSIFAYRQFLTDVLTMGFKRVCVTGASVPTIDDDVNMSEIANKRREITVGLGERTHLTLKYNQELNRVADDMGLSYFDISGAVLDRSSGVVHDFFRNPDRSDHHLDKLKVAGVWAERCNAFLAGRL